MWEVPLRTQPLIVSHKPSPFRSVPSGYLWKRRSHGQVATDHFHLSVVTGLVPQAAKVFPTLGARGKNRKNSRYELGGRGFLNGDDRAHLPSCSRTPHQHPPTAAGTRVREPLAGAMMQSRCTLGVYSLFGRPPWLRLNSTTQQT